MQLISIDCIWQHEGSTPRKTKKTTLQSTSRLKPYRKREVYPCPSWWRSNEGEEVPRRWRSGGGRWHGGFRRRGRPKQHLGGESARWGALGSGVDGKLWEQLPPRLPIDPCETAGSRVSGANRLESPAMPEFPVFTAETLSRPESSVVTPESSTPPDKKCQILWGTCMFARRACF